MNEASGCQTSNHIISSQLNFCSVGRPCVEWHLWQPWIKRLLSTWNIIWKPWAEEEKSKDISSDVDWYHEKGSGKKPEEISGRRFWYKSNSSCGVEHFCIEKEIVPSLNKFLSAVKEKKIYIYIFFRASNMFYTVEHTIWDSSGRAVNKGRTGLERKEIVCHRYIVYKRYVL